MYSEHLGFTCAPLQPRNTGTVWVQYSYFVHTLLLKKPVPATVQPSHSLLSTTMSSKMTESNKDSTKHQTPPPYIRFSRSSSKAHPYHDDRHRELPLTMLLILLSILTLFAILLAALSALSDAHPSIIPTTVTFLCASTLFVSAVPLSLAAYISFLTWPNVDTQTAYEQFPDCEPDVPVALREVRQQLLSNHHCLYTVLYLLLLYAVMLVIQATILHKAVCESGNPIDGSTELTRYL